MYYKLHNAIRNNDNEHVIFFEKALIDFTGSCGFDEGPGGVAYNDRQAYSYHIYCAPTNSVYYFFFLLFFYFIFFFLFFLFYFYFC